MRDWKKTDIPYVRVYRYFQAHETKFFTSEHIAAQIGVGRKQTRAIIQGLELAGKVEGVDLVEALRWGRTRRIWRSLGRGTYPLRQVEIFPAAYQGPT